MVGDSAAKKKRRDRLEASGAAGAAAAAGVTSAPDAGVVASAAARALAEGTGKRKNKKKRERQQTLEDERQEAAGSMNSLSSVTRIGNGNTEPRAASGSKKRKKGGGQQPAGAAIATAGGKPGAGSSASPQPRSLACTTKVAEYTEIGGSKTSPSPSSAQETATQKTTKKNKKNKKKKDKRDKTKGRGTPSNHATRTPSIPGRAEETTSSESHGPYAGAGSSVSNNHDNGHGDVPVLEGIFHEGAMYLADAAGKAFSSQRDEQGGLVEVGTYDKDRGKVVVMVDPVSLPAEGASTNHDSASVDVDADVGGSGKKKTKGKGKGKGKGKKDGAKIKDACKPETEAVVDYPFEVEECDHCETSERAYADIAPLLSALAAELGKAPEELVIYDPYFCQGSTVARLASLGFPRVHNRKEDFYEVVKNGTVPEHDVVVTNPPFSGEHVPEILSFCAHNGTRPWLLLLPNYVYLKDYYETSLGRGPGRSATLPFYLTPPKRYVYYSPVGSRLKVKSSERKTSPFNTFWYIRLGGGGVTSKILQSYDAVSRKAEGEARCCVARTTQQIPYKMMDSNDPRRKKARDRQRSIDRIRKKKSEWVLS